MDANRNLPKDFHLRISRFNYYWLPVLLCAILIFCFSSIPGTQVPGVFAGQEIVFHIAEYALLAFLLHRAMKAYFPAWSFLKRCLWVVVMAALYAAGDEVHQSFVPYRECSLFDWGMDTLGMLISCSVYR